MLHPAIRHHRTWVQFVSENLFMRSESGTYALILRGDSRARVQVGRWGTLGVQPGYWIYVGSAFGPGGVNARVLRHCREAKAKRWHIDYLRDVTAPVGAWCGYGSRDLEHRWAHALAGLRGLTSVPGFGCSDCACESHLFRCSDRPALNRFLRVAGGPIESWYFRTDGGD